MLHDFVSTELHTSKIYHVVKIKDKEIREACCNHHKKGNENQLVKAIKRYDERVAFLTRRKPVKTITRYDYEQGEIDFEWLAQEIEQRSDSAYKLYSFIYHSNELHRTVESLNYFFYFIFNLRLLPCRSYCL